MVDLSEMLDAESSDDEVKKAASGKGKQAATKLSAKELAGRDFNEDFSLGHSDDESEEEDDEVLRAMGSSDSDEEAENGDEQQGTDDEMAGEGSDAKARLSRLDGFVTSISARAPKRRFVSETGGHFAEDENAIGSGLANKGVSLGLNDLLGSLGTEAADDTAEGGEQKATREIRALKDRVQKLERAAKKTGAGVVAAPLAKRLQDQVDRKVAYEKTKKTISEWQPTVNANRAAEHLSFPMNEPEKQVASSASLVSTFHTKTNLESQIQSILAESGMTDEQQQQYEELELKALSPEELRKRRRELRLMRELMFRSEQKAKRMAKIKSKAYRRILKKEKTKAQDKAMERLKEDDPEMYNALMEKMAQNRAEERMTLRHKNTGKWAKDTLKRSHGDVDAQKALREQLDQHDSLKRKIYDLGSDEDVSDYEAGRSQGRDGGNVSDSDEDASFDAIKARTVKRISAEMASGDDDQIAEDTPHKALFGMKFMQNAMQRKREQADRDAQMMRDEFESLEADVDEDGNAISLKKKKADAKAAEPMAAGRMSFGGGLKKRNPDEENRDEGDDGVIRAEDDTPAKRVRLNEAGQIGQVASGGGHKVRLAEPMSIGMPSTISGSGGSKGQAAGKGADNPWLSEEAASHAGHRGGKLSELSKESTKLDKLSAKLRAKRLDRGVGSAGGEEDVLLDVNKTLSLEKPRMGDDSEGGESDSDSDDGIKLEHIDSSKKGKKGKKTPSNPNAFTQRELVEQAFAEDAIVEEEFEAEKEAVMNEEAPKEEDLTLPGWGSWGGTGLSSKKKVIRKAPAGSGVEKSSRLDAKLGSVIINQRQSKSATKYFADNVPFPFYTPEEYEETLQAPLGKEWNTTRSHSKMVKPRVMTKMGRIIDPLVIPSKKKQ
ncbi:small-subunit processome [Martensiomyces pterosporus]|nr:small-subunit processome [Martensiomyces pterosporus]